MKSILAVFAVLVLAGCGVETASSAATAGAMKKQEIEQGKKTMDRLSGRVEESLSQDQQRLQQSADRAGR
jgi:outer membrane lipopolysaccharide assembly protein LptE/RlpB